MSARLIYRVSQIVLCELISGIEPHRLAKTCDGFVQMTLPHDEKDAQTIVELRVVRGEIDGLTIKFFCFINLVSFIVCLGEIVNRLCILWCATNRHPITKDIFVDETLPM